MVVFLLLHQRRKNWHPPTTTPTPLPLPSPSPIPSGEEGVGPPMGGGEGQEKKGYFERETMGPIIWMPPGKPTTEMKWISL